MNKFVLCLPFFFIAIGLQAQTKDSLACSPDFFMGTWKSASDSMAGMMEVSDFELEFSHDSCCNIIYNGKRMECNEETRTITYSINCSTIPKQMDIEVVTRTSYGLKAKSAIRFIFEIVDADHIKTGMTAHQYNDRPKSFADENVVLKLFYRRK